MQSDLQCSIGYKQKLRLAAPILDLGGLAEKQKGLFSMQFLYS